MNEDWLVQKRTKSDLDLAKRAEGREEERKESGMLLISLVKFGIAAIDFR